MGKMSTKNDQCSFTLVRKDLHGLKTKFQLGKTVRSYNHITLQRLDEVVISESEANLDYTVTSKQPRHKVRPCLKSYRETLSRKTKTQNNNKKTLELGMHLSS